MAEITSPPILPISGEDEPAVLALNNLNAADLSLLDPAGLRALLAGAFYARRIGSVEAFLISFDETANYDSPNFLWFRARYPRFAYVDRICVGEAARGRGHARRLYLDLFDTAAADGHERVVCEVNAEPPNPGSDAFHAAMGFLPVGEATIHGGAKKVRYYERRLDR